MPDQQRRIARWVLYACLFAASAVAVLFVSVIIVFALSSRFWLIPRGLVPGMFLLCTILLSGLLLVGRRKRQRWLMAFSLGGASTTVFMLVLALVHPLWVEKPRPPKPLTSPSGKYVLTRRVEPAPSVRAKDFRGRYLPYWFVTIAEPGGRILYRDPQPTCQVGLPMRVTWDANDCAWFHDRESHIVYVYRCVDGTWERHEWGYDKTGEIIENVALHGRPESAKIWPVMWELSGLDRGSGPTGKAMVSLRNTKTGAVIELRVGEAKEGITLVEADPRKEEVIVQFEGELYLLSKQTSR